MRLNWGGRVCITKRSPTLSEPHTVDAAGTWDEDYCSYPGRSAGYVAAKKDEFPTAITRIEIYD